MTKVKLFFAAFFALLSFSLVLAACASEGDSPVYVAGQEDLRQSKTFAVYKAGGASDYSDYTKKTLAAIKTGESPASAVPDFFIVKGSSAGTLSSSDVLLAVKTFEAGNIILIDAPSQDSLEDFCTNVVTVLSAAENYYVRNDADMDGRSLSRALIQAVNNKGGRDDPYERKNYEAVALKKNIFYFVHDIDEVLPLTPNQKNKRRVTRSGSLDCGGSSAEIVDPKVEFTRVNPSANYAQIESDSIEGFSLWLCGAAPSSKPAQISAKALAAIQGSAAQAALADARDAQTFVHNFTATFDYGSYDHYDGRYDGKNESVDLTIDVWCACQINDPTDITKNTDYYLVRTSMACNNNQLNFSNDWDNSKYLSPYFDCSNIDTAFDTVSSGKISIRTQDCSPQNAVGSTTFSTGSSYSIGGNVGFNASGPTGGVSVGYSVSQSTSRSIPDISVNFSKPQEDELSWAYSTPEDNPYWGGFMDLYTKCDSPKDIQTRLAIFDTYGLYLVQSGENSGSGLLEVATNARVRLTMITGWLESALTLCWYHLSCDNWANYYDNVIKPSNTFAEFIMTFTPPAGTSTQDIAAQQAAVQKFISDWNASQRYYAVADDNSDIDNALLAAAKSYFASAKKKINDNKNVLQDAGFKGDYKFYVQKVDGGAKADEFELTF